MKLGNLCSTSFGIPQTTTLQFSCISQYPASTSTLPPLFSSVVFHDILLQPPPFLIYPGLPQPSCFQAASQAAPLSKKKKKAKPGIARVDIFFQIIVSSTFVTDTCTRTYTYKRIYAHTHPAIHLAFLLLQSVISCRNYSVF